MVSVKIAMAQKNQDRELFHLTEYLVMIAEKYNNNFKGLNHEDWKNTLKKNGYNKF